MDFDKAIKSISDANFLKNKNCSPYIAYLRFPRFKNLISNLCVNFDFPVTVLIGANGTNKTSVLRAAYGAVANKSISEFWYESKIDKIKDRNNNRSSVICGYYNDSIGDVVECIKQRTYSRDKGSFYWETAKPSKRYGMKPMPEKIEGVRGRKTTRWEPPVKNVLYIDFKHQMHGAYDRFFYFDRFVKTQRVKTKQDFVRIKSRHLKNVIDKNKESYVYNKLERVFDNRELNSDAVDYISRILGRKYSSIRVVRHTFYVPESRKNINNEDNAEITVFMREKTSTGNDYSEAFAGSGELAVVLLVDQILRADDRSLILLDEPEISLHPEAQKKIIEFLVEQTLKKKHQIIIATHSPFISDLLPKEALKLLYVNGTGKVDIAGNVNPEVAFARIGATGEKTSIFVEDECAKLLINKFLKFNNFENLFNVMISPSGCDWLLQNLISAKFEGREKVFFILDGDQKRCALKKSAEIPEKDWDVYLRNIFNKDVARIKIPNKKCNSGDLRIIKKELIDYIFDHLLFLPTNTPEEFLYRIDESEILDLNGVEYKNKLREEARQQFDDDSAESIRALIRKKLNSINPADNETVVLEMNKIVQSMIDRVSNTN